MQFYVPNQQTQHEEYAHHRLFMHYPFRSENNLKFGNPPTYSNKIRKSNVIELVNQNHSKVESFETINEVFERFNSELETNMDPFGQHENDETYDQQSQQPEESDTDNCDAEFSEIENQSRYADATTRQTPLFSDDMINEHIRSLNEEQQKVFDVLHKWSKDFIKNVGSKRPQTINSFHIFITGGGAVGESHLIKTIHMSLSKVLMHKGGGPENPRILLLAPTGVAAVHINGATIHCGLLEVRCFH